MKTTTLVGIFALTMTLLAFNASAQTNVLVNGDFENGQTVGAAPTSWTTSTASTVVPVGLTTGSTQSAQIGTVSGELLQPVANVGTEFSFDCYFAVLTPSGDRTFKIVLGTDIVTMRVSTGGIFQFFKVDTWKTQTLTTTTPSIQFCTDNNANNVIDSGDSIKAYRLKLVFHKWAMAGQNFDLYLSDVNSSTLNLVASGLTYFHHVPKIPLESVKFALSTATKPFLVDDVSIIKNQVITFGALDSKATTDADFDLTATSSAGLPVTYTSSDKSVATVTGSTVHIVGAGETDIKASAAATTDVTAAPDVIQKLYISTTTALKLTNSDVRFTVVNRKLMVTGTTDAIKAFTVTGAQVNATKALNPGLYIVKVGSQTTKVMVL